MIRVGIVFGGRSAEHEVSLQSARNVVDALDRNRYQAVLLGIDKQGRWLHYADESRFLENAGDPKRICLAPGGRPVTLLPWGNDGRLVALDPDSGNEEAPLPQVDVIFPVLHGPLGEDGTIQGLFRLAEVPFVGSGVLGSAAGMDKDAMKRLFVQAGIPVAPWRLLRSAEEADFTSLSREFGLPLFVKPANMGSSVGVHRVFDREALERALKDAFRFDLKVLVEKAIPGREIECSVLGDQDPQASVPGEIVPNADFYSYEAKYVDEDGAQLIIPARFSRPELTGRIQDYAIRGFRALCCRGLARADFFLSDDNEVFLNELNTMPGFTRISMYPKLWDASGIPYPDLIHRLIQLALTHHARRSNLATSYL
ncbi:MAG TPA: D-alanine--D-alanine ligase [Acidobacteriota bacterium]|nr:D-alanine--D-alanine ligase [Acidobacteriota bacterium]